jgi:hypothetical protein
MTMRILALVAILVASVSAQAPASSDALPGFNDINPEDCRKWLTVLASDEFEGRDSGTPGYQKAADMVAGLFKEFGLKAVGDRDAAGNPTYFQQVPFVSAALDAESAVFEVSGGAAPISPKPGEGFGATGLGSLSVEGEVTFVVAQSGQKLPDFDVTGRVVIVIVYGADGALARAQGGMTADLRRAGAATVLRIDDVTAARGMGTTSAVRKDHFRPSPDKKPAVAISRALADSVAKAEGRDIETLVAKAKEAGTPVSVRTKLRTRINLATKVTDIPVPNVLGFLEGSDPKLKSELVIVGSHLDHLGRGNSGEIFNGADDDGSGSTGLLAVARAFSKNPRPPKRSVLFIAFCGEEKGLLGSEWYVEHPAFPNESVIAELQMDMIGRSEEAHQNENPGNETAEQNANTLHLIGAKKIAPALNELVVKINADHTKFELEYDQEGVYYRSDHYNFAKKGIPIAFFFTGFHRDYHQPSDDVEKIDFPKLARVAQLVYMTGWSLAERPERLPIEKAKKPGREAR